MRIARRASRHDEKPKKRRERLTNVAMDRPTPVMLTLEHLVTSSTTRWRPSLSTPPPPPPDVSARDINV
jgi:hypothetical protein